MLDKSGVAWINQHRLYRAVMAIHSTVWQIIDRYSILQVSMLIQRIKFSDKPVSDKQSLAVCIMHCVHKL